MAAAEPAAQPNPFERPEQRPMPFEFSGSGREYFGIWIVNLLLSILTLGIYSAWAKVRRLQYFYRNTSVAGSSFDFHGPPLAILKGRIVGVTLLLLYNFSFKIDPIVGLASFFALAAVMPWLLQRSLRFKLHYSSYRALRFRFGACLGESYLVFLILPVVSVLTLYLMGPLWHQALKRYQLNNSFFGDTAFDFDGRIRSFYRIYLVAVGLAVLFLAASGSALGSTLQGLRQLDPRDPRTRMILALLPLVFLGLLLLFSLFISPYVIARIQNLVWNHTRLGPHRFESRVSARRLFFIMLTNLVGVVLTLGLYKPFAVVRLLKYRLESVSLAPAGDLEHFVAAPEQPVGAAGEETADMFDFDIGL
jgi:uncharacterized membrane protein YjgN (DUF898 family)